MSKYADRYFKIEPWRVVEKDFDPDYALISESIFSLGNEYMGLRGYFEEGYSGKRLQGSYINGVYEIRRIPKSGYKGMIDETEFMVNTVDWAAVTISCNGVRLDLQNAVISAFERVLDLSTGVLSRTFDWRPDDQTEIKITFERFLSMDYPELAGQRIHFVNQKGHAKVAVEMKLDFSNIHHTVFDNLWRCEGLYRTDNALSITGFTQNTHQPLRATCLINQTGKKSESLALNINCLSSHFSFEINEGETETLERLVKITKPSDQTVSQANMDLDVAILSEHSYEALKRGTADWWQRQWALSDILIDGDEANQQGIRFCIFQMHQTLHTANHTAIIGAKGLTGEAYNGNTFWDSEVYCLPFYLFNNQDAARSILAFRYQTLEAAKERAKALDLKGAFFPVATISGKECCDLWQHASLQLQASTAVAYGIWHYMIWTEDHQFLETQGAEILVEISRMLASRGDFDPIDGRYGYYGVMGPDEFQMMVHHNTYTNYMGMKALYYTVTALENMARQSPNAFSDLVNRLKLSHEEIADWRFKADHMKILYDPQTHLFEQHDGYFKIPEKKLSEIPVEEFPLYHHWSYDRIYRNKMLKQPDVLMFMVLYNSDFNLEQHKANFGYYEPRCIHESSLSPSIHSILASQIGEHQRAYDLFQFATRMDLDNYNRNTHEGLHTTSIAGSWMNIVYGFGGLRTDCSQLVLSPTIPATWDRYRFKLSVKGVVLSVTVTQDEVLLSTDHGELLLSLYGKLVCVDENGYTSVLGG